MTEFSWPTAETRAAVVRAGWSPDRQVSIEQWVAPLSGQGYYFSPMARAILGSLGGLVIRPLNDAPEATWASNPVHFDPFEAADGLYERYRPLEHRLGHRMSPLASWSAESVIMLLDDGRVVSDSSMSLNLLGSTFPEALDLALRRYRRPDVLIGYEPRPSGR
jgi:hypothetical protein